LSGGDEAIKKPREPYGTAGGAVRVIHRSRKTKLDLCYFDVVVVTAMHGECFRGARTETDVDGHTCC